MSKIFQPDFFNQRGLNLQSIFNIDDIPEAINKTIEPLPEISKYTQLVLLGHGGKKLWQTIKKSEFKSQNPIDDFTIKTIRDFFDQDLGPDLYKIIYPGANLVPLIPLGEIAGWHNLSLFRIGINEKWGTWFAYRAAILTKSSYEPMRPITQGKSPCVNCHTKPCIINCPVQAISESKFDFKACHSYRVKQHSKCKDRCIARLSCPIAPEHQYSEEQIKYHYGLSLKTLQRIL